MLCVVFAVQCGWAKDKGLHLGGMDKDQKKAQIELKKSQQAAEKEAKKKEKELRKKKKEAEKEAKKREKEMERKMKKEGRSSDGMFGK